jgi:hypothetical protein
MISSCRKSGNVLYTDKKENNIFLIYKEIQMGSGAKSYMSSEVEDWRFRRPENDEDEMKELLMYQRT